jgi:hypothetical protein
MGDEGKTLRLRLELWSAALLAAATLATAYSAYESTRWSGVQATSFTQAGADRTESAKANSDAAALISIDANLFTQYAVAFTEQNQDLQRILRTRFFRKEFLPAFRAWLAQDPSNNPNAAKNPFVLPEYRVAKVEEADRLEDSASAKFDDGRDANQNSDDYVLATIFFAAVLFFAGVASKFQSDRVMMFLLAFGSVAFVAGLARLATLPFH